MKQSDKLSSHWLFATKLDRRIKSVVMLLAIDVGNTNITLGLYDGRTWRRQWRLQTVLDRTVDEYGVYYVLLVD